MPIDQIFIYILLGIVLILAVWITLLEIKFKKLPSVKSDQKVNDRLTNLEKNSSELNIFKEQTTLKITSINNEIKETIQGIETIRFNPFKGDGIGGDQSFATALLDKNGNGIILSSLYSRQKVSVFAKPISNWISKYEMTEEEKEVLEKAKARKTK
ncbi:hypothetical protein A3I18_01430 [Candidatus Campbellbacteria bacterium RIFCSPLOWO2_02_FULL_35_11]|uniref:DUF4446 domain-containing protein n=2 Tax=Candidatus Campbelliibacteriota TaxID=1752727 RepID=A0A1F5EL17_9BACT|nr:MAG: hypothetical protein A3E89_00480 [Candidatus Campbellbacteria bacterium RIFCSPHIGHO2_12_FULL_35_10]OGD70316.1 MAG: hypothetical protein A3I18_01430 [Candidatus Campbellbacteria bacterium RIFCSPLOWO2_02_FULL_35_11]